MSARGRNVESENMITEHEEVLAAELVVTTKHQEMTQWHCMRVLAAELELVITMLEDIMTTKLVLMIAFNSGHAN